MTGKELREIRHRLGWTLKVMADEIGTTLTSVARWERGEVGISEPVARLVGFIVKRERRGAPRSRARRGKRT
jgi:transcriptional regulator with XRE-family HTH domain